MEPDRGGRRPRLSAIPGAGYFTIRRGARGNADEDDAETSQERQLRLSRTYYWTYLSAEQRVNALKPAIVRVPPQLPAECRRGFVNFLNKIAMLWDECDCCMAYRPFEALKECRDANRLSQHDIVGPVARLCRKCWAFKPSRCGVMCPYSRSANSLYLDAIPPVLSNLSFMERQLIRLVVPFQSLLVLYGGVGLGRSGGQVIHIPTSPAEMLGHVIDPLPLAERSLVTRQAKPKGGYTHWFRTSLVRVREALRWLSDHNWSLYGGLYEQLSEIYGEQLEELAESERVVAAREATSFDVPLSESVLLSLDDIEVMDRRTLPANTSQPVANMAERVEEKSFPELFPLGRGGFMEPRETPLTLKQYAKSQLLLKDSRFQASPSWLFRMLVLVYRSDMYGQISFIERQCASSRCRVDGMGAPRPDLRATDILEAARNERETIEASSENVSRLLKSYYRSIGRKIRGSSAYWASARSQLEGLVASLGPPTLFLTLGNRDLSWLDFWMQVDPVRFQTDADVGTLSEHERKVLLEKHAVLAAEHYKRRLRAMMDLLKKSPVLGGKIATDYFYRIEYQLRGSPHAHILLWMDNVPDAAAEPASYLEWLDECICCEVPRGDDVDHELRALVKQFQYHKHTFTCEVNNNTKNTKRKNPFKERHKSKTPKGGEPESDPSCSEDEKADTGADERENCAWRDTTGPFTTEKERKAFWAQHKERRNCRFGMPHPLSAETHFRRDGFERRYMVRGDREIIFRRREREDQYTNNYNPIILRLWQANMDLQPVADAVATCAYVMAYVSKAEKSESLLVREALEKLDDTSLARRVCCAIGNTIISSRHVSLQEAAMLLLSEPLYRSSRGTFWVDTTPPHKRTLITKPAKALEAQNPESTNVYMTRALEHYESRPVTGSFGEFWSSLTAHDFFAWFEQVGRFSRSSTCDEDGAAEEEDSDADGDDEDDFANVASNVSRKQASDEHLRVHYEINPEWNSSHQVPPFIRIAGSGGPGRKPVGKIMCGTGAEFRLRGRARCVRSRLSSAAPLESCYSLLLLHYPFVNELRDLFGWDDDAPTFPSNDTDFLDLVRLSCEERLEVLQSSIAFLSPTAHLRGTQMLDVFQSITLPEVTRQVAPAVSYQQEEAVGGADENAVASLHDRLLQDSLAPAVSRVLLQVGRHAAQRVDISQLDEFQARVCQITSDYLSAMRSWRLELTEWEGRKDWRTRGLEPPGLPPVRPPPPHIFVHGPAGSGKSHLVNALKQLITTSALREWTREACPTLGVITAAPTGVAACNIGGNTLHQLFRLPVEDNGWQSGARRLTDSEVDQMARELCKAEVLIIDEVSMVSASVFAKVNARMNRVFAREHGMEHAPEPVVFGGRMVILFGDLCQLPPVKAHTIFSEDCNLSIGGFHLFKSFFHPVMLRRVHRQASDVQWAELLENIRSAANLEECEEVLRKRCLNPLVNPLHYREISALYRRPEWQSALHLYPTRALVEESNALYTRQLAGARRQPVFQVFAEDYDLKSQERMSARSVKEQGLDTDERRTASLLFRLELTIGMRLMLRVNLSARDGMYNGACGSLAEIEWATPPHNSSVGVVPCQEVPRGIWVRFDDQSYGEQARHRNNSGGYREVFIERVTRDFSPGGSNGRQPKFRRTQLPVIPCHAASIHKAQSMTLDRVVIHAARTHSPGMGYVALSRAKSLAGIILLEFNPSALKVSNKALAEYQRLATLEEPGPGNSGTAVMVQPRASCQGDAESDCFQDDSDVEASDSEREDT